MSSDRKPFKVSTVTAKSCVGDLPQVANYCGGLSSFDIFIVANGFEERVLAFPQKFVQEDQSIRLATLVGKYQTNQSDNNERYRELRPILEKISPKIFEFEADEPGDVVVSIQRCLNLAGDEQFLHVAFDVSGASSTLILSVMAALSESERAIQLSVLYASADEYDQPPLNDLQSFELIHAKEVGLGAGPFSAPFSGHHHDHLPSAVIALPSMYTDRLEACLTYLNVGPITGGSDNLFWLLPSTGVDKHIWRQSRIKHAVESLLLKLQGNDGRGKDEVIASDDMTTCDVLDYIDTARTLIDAIDQRPGKNISIVHMGSKMQAIGVALAAAARSEVAVLTARPSSFNAAKYSEGIGSLYVVSIPILSRIVEEMKGIGSLKVDSL
ncbi:hypothetical protein [Xanthomonas arboricola]|uniref:hypothetical protein n=1 Tax=Xanthomonas arboricola TaxID=56448 RepID=UPI0011B06570|nr:hypothetical protein [Xanthomonas arboricola]